MLDESYTCDICGASKITLTRKIDVQIKQFFREEKTVKSDFFLHVCKDCSSRWPMGADFFDWFRERLKEKTRLEKSFPRGEG